MRRVFMFSSHPLFSQGIESLLRGETGLEIVGRETEADRVAEHIEQLRPDVVIFDVNGSEIDCRLAVMRILSEGLGIKVIGLNLHENMLCVYRSQRREIKGVEDLMDAIEI